MTIIFSEDRSDILWRGLPRLAVGTAMKCLVLLAVGLLLARTPTEHFAAYLLVAATGVVAMAIRFDVVALQFGRRITYEVSQDQFRAFRGEQEVCSFAFADVESWLEASPADLFDYWTGNGYSRAGVFGTHLDRYEFRMSKDFPPPVVSPPALFRWKDRGGLVDVTQILIERIGCLPENDPRNYL